MNQLNVAFRVDASDQIGVGHFMRCLTLAEEFKRRGAKKIQFISRHLPPYFVDLLTAKGLGWTQNYVEDTTASCDDLCHSDWLGVSQFKDAEYTIEALRDSIWEWVIVDHYALDERWEKMVGMHCKHVMVIDDLADRHHYCDLLLDQNYYQDMVSRYIGKVPLNCQLLLGPSYALLRDEFRGPFGGVMSRSADIYKVLIFFGGIDRDNCTTLALAALAKVDKKLYVDVVIGRGHPYLESIKKICLEYNYNFHVEISNMAELMLNADFSIGAAGSSSWERCRVGLPAFVVAIAKNQIPIAEALSAYGACVYLGQINKHLQENIIQTINKFIKSPKDLRFMSSKALSLVDGIGVDRVCSAMNG